MPLVRSVISVGGGGLLRGRGRGSLGGWAAPLAAWGSFRICLFGARFGLLALYIPMLDHTFHPDISYDNLCHYPEIKAKLIGAA